MSYSKTLSLSMLLGGFIALQGCATKDSISKTDDTAMIQAGFASGSIFFQKDKETPCDYLIKLDDGSLLEPAGLGEEFKKDGLKIWVQYAASRRVSLCENSMPITISEIKKKS
jgi:hypothetical protein